MELLQYRWLGFRRLHQGSEACVWLDDGDCALHVFSRFCYELTDRLHRGLAVVSRNVLAWFPESATVTFVGGLLAAVTVVVRMPVSLKVGVLLCRCLAQADRKHAADITAAGVVVGC